MMEEWKEYKLGEIISIAGGFAYKGNLIGKGDNYLLGMGCVSFAENFLDKGARKYDGDCPERYYAKPGDIVLATRQQSDNLPILGMPAIIPSKYEGHKMIIGANLYRVVIKDTSFDNRYLYWLLKTPAYVSHIRSCQSGTTVRMITKSNIEDFVFCAPNQKSRNAISDFIWALDDKIELNRRINANLEAQAQALFKSWFVDFEPFRDGEFVESELGMIPRGWRVGTFSDFFEIMPGGTPSTNVDEYWNDGKIPFFSPKDVNGVYCFDTEKHITELGLKNCSSHLYPKDTLFITARGTVGKIALAATPMAMNQSNYALVAKDNVGKYYLFLLTKTLISILLKKANGAVFSAITTKDFKEPTIVPPIDIILNIENMVKPIFDKIYQTSKESRRLTSLRDTLLPRLMSGEIKVGDVTL